MKNKASELIHHFKCFDNEDNKNIWRAFYHTQNKIQNRKCPVYLEIVVNGSRGDRSLKSPVYYEDWNINKWIVKPKNQELNH